MEYNLEFDFYYLPTSSFKEKSFNLTVSHLVKGRFGSKLKYKCPANISFESDDKKHKYPKITEFEAFKRKYTNCIVFDLVFDEDNRGYYNKLFLYFSDGKQPSYGYLLYNTETNERLHKYLIFGDINDVFYALNGTFNTLHNKKLYDFYNRKYNSAQNLNGYTKMDYPTEAELEEILKEMKSGY